MIPVGDDGMGLFGYGAFQQGAPYDERLCDVVRQQRVVPTCAREEDYAHVIGGAAEVRKGRDGPRLSEGATPVGPQRQPVSARRREILNVELPEEPAGVGSRAPDRPGAD